MDNTKLNARLERFAIEQNINSKGSLCVVLLVTRTANKQEPPYAPENFLTSHGGQMLGLGRGGVQPILEDHGIVQVLPEEGGSARYTCINRMRAYLDLLNSLNVDGLLDFTAIEEWWIQRVKAYFAAKPFKLKLDSSKSLQNMISELIEAAFDRQRERRGVMVAGAVMHHLVGAKLELALPGIHLEHKGFSVANAPGGRKGDFLIGDTAIHVTTAPLEALIRKCSDNLTENLRPLVVTTESGVGGVVALAKNADLADRIDIFEVEQFVTANIYKSSWFKNSQHTVIIRELLNTYNRIVEQVETDPSLRIKVG